MIEVEQVFFLLEQSTSNTKPRYNFKLITDLKKVN